MKRFIRNIALFLIILLIVLLAGLKWLQSSAGFNKSVELSNSLLTEYSLILVVEDFSGTFLHDFDLRGIQLRNKETGEQKLFIDQLQVVMNPWAILDSKIEFGQISIDSVQFNLRADSSDILWQLMQPNANSEIPEYALILPSLKVSKANLSVEQTSRKVSIDSLDFHSKIQFSGQKGLYFEIDYLSGSLGYQQQLEDSTDLDLAWLFSGAVNPEKSSYLQLSVQSSNTSTPKKWAIPSVLNLQVNGSDDDTTLYHLSSGILLEVNQEIQLEADFSLNPIQLKKGAKIRYKDPFNLKLIPKRVNYPFAESMELRLEKDLSLSDSWQPTDSLHYALNVKRIYLPEFPKKQYDIVATGQVNLLDFGSKNHVELGRGAGSSISLDIDTKEVEDLFVVDIESDDESVFKASDWLPKAFDIDATLRKWHLKQQLRFNLNDGFFEGNIQFLALNNQFQHIPISEFRIEGKYSAIGANLNGLLYSEAGNIGVQLFGVHFEDAIEHEIITDIQGLDLGAWLKIPNFKTHISSSGSIIGSGQSPFQAKSSIRFSLRPSDIQGAKIDTAVVLASLDEGMLSIEQIRMNSEIIEGLMNAEINLNEPFSPSNKLEGYFQLIDPSPIAPLIGMDTLNATGFITAKINPGVDGRILFTSGFELENLVTSSENRIDQVNGLMMVPMERNPEMIGSIQLLGPQIGAFRLNTLNLNVATKILRNGPEGNIQIGFENKNQTKANLEADFKLHEKQLMLNLQQLGFQHEEDSLITEVSSGILIASDIIRIEPIRLLNLEDQIEIGFGFEKSHEKLNGFLNAKRFDLMKAQRCFLESYIAEGFLEADIKLTGTPEEFQIQGPLSIHQLKYGDFFFPTIKTQIQANELAFDLFATVENSVDSSKVKTTLVEMNMKGNWQLDSTFHFNSKIPRNALSSWKPIHPLIEQRLSTWVQGNIQLMGDPASPEIHSQLLFEKLAHNNTVYSDSVTIRLDQNSNSNFFQIESAIYSGNKEAFHFSAKSPLLGYLKGQDAPFTVTANDSLQMQLKANDLDLRLFNSIPLLQEYFIFEKGFLNTNLSVNSPINDIWPEGAISIDQINLNWPAYGLKHHSGFANVVVSDSGIILNEFLLKDDQGELKVEGSWKKGRNQREDQISFTSRTKNFQVLNNDQGQVRAESRLGINGSTTFPKLTGDIDLKRGRFIIDAFDENKVVAGSALIQDSSAVDSISTPYLDQLKAEVTLKISPSLLIRNQSYPRVELFPEGELDLVKNGGQTEWQFFGEISSRKGLINLLGKRFNLEKSNLQFDGPMDNPLVDIEAKYSIPKPHQVTIWYGITGRLEEPKLSYRSDPQMEVQNMISYILFNKPFYALESWEQTLATTDQNTGGDASTIAIQLLASRIEQLASQRLGIDLVQIDNTRSGSRNATTLKTGWYLNEKTFFAIMNELGVPDPETQFILEYLIGRDLNMILTQSNNDRTRLDIRWSRDY